MSESALYPPGRGQRHECTQCGRNMDKAARVFMDMAFCGTCYAREFLRRPCSRCLAPAMLHKSQDTGLCRSCIKLTRVCQRCEKPVRRAALIVNDAPVCASCRRHFEPYPKSYKPADHQTCSVCRKYRKPVNKSGPPLCAKCAASDRREEVEEIEQAYWMDYLLGAQESLRMRLTQDWCRTLFDGFVEHQVESVSVKPLALRIERYLPMFQSLEQRFKSLAEIHANSLLENYTPEELRRAEAVVSFLYQSGVGVPTRDKLEDTAERRRIRAIIGSVRDPNHAQILEEFLRLRAGPSSGDAPSVKTLRVSLRAACGLLEITEAGFPAQRDVARYLRGRPGQRAALASFIGFLRGRGVEVSLPAKPKKPRPKKNTASSGVSLESCLAMLKSSDEYGQLRAAAVGAVVGLLGLPLSDVVRYPRTQITGDEQALKLTIDGEVVTLDPRLAVNLMRYIAMRDRKIGNKEGFLFPGRASHQHVSEAAVTYHFKEWGVSARELGALGRSFLKREAQILL